MYVRGVRASVFDLLVFAVLETLGIVAVCGNLSLIIILIKFNYLTKASFILLLSLALANVVHGIVTSFYFYPPIALKRQHFSLLWMRIFNVLDWTAWAITLTHISAISLDRLIAIIYYVRYSSIVSVNRVRKYSIIKRNDISSVFCWIFFTILNLVLFTLDACCVIIPLEDHEFYSFGYQRGDGSGVLGQANLYVYAYTPLETSTILILFVSNPIILVQLYRRWKRKFALQR
ncbi:unnamed protein product [Gongylonema pulchrum]|uniref:G_PROTEIN_RECEP_F1_2 domain-containing protein n=1 Tax=Gongylonema pulchrum TaxID=637853 RepID=A0A183CXV4_9BILA|nr:unnamed protein product [Gongylonema pulchrum]